MEKRGVGLYGSNGHQVPRQLHDAASDLEPHDGIGGGDDPAGQHAPVGEVDVVGRRRGGDQQQGREGGGEVPHAPTLAGKRRLDQPALTRMCLRFPGS